MAFTSGPHQSPQSSLPPLSVKQVNTITWGANSNTSSTVTDEYVHTNSAIYWWVTGVTPAAGSSWAITVSQGSFFWTSTDSENTALTISYIVL